MSDLAELLKRVEAASGPDREIDVEIVRLVELPRSSRHKLFDGVWFVNVCHPGDEVVALLEAKDPSWVLREDWRRPGPYDIAGYNQPDYTRSIDAAVALIEKVLPGVCWSIHKKNEPTFGGPARGEVFLYRKPGERGGDNVAWFGGAKEVEPLWPGTVWAKTVPLALCAALLRSRLSEDEGGR